MRLVTFTTPEKTTHIGALIESDKHIIDFTAMADQGKLQLPLAFQSMQSLIEAGEPALELARKCVTTAPQQFKVATSECQLLSPLPRPEQIRCFSTFEEHARESAKAMMRVMAAQQENPAAALDEMQKSGRFNIPPIFYERPLYYKGNRFSVVGPDAEISWPGYSEMIDFELELAAVIGRTGRDIAAADATPYIFGYAAFNDLTARDEQAREMVAPLGPAKGKDFDGGNVMGPCIVTADELPDPYQLKMAVRVNDELWSENTSTGMAHKFEDMIAYVSRSETIHPGEVFLSGCMGKGSGLELGRNPQRGDTISMQIEHIGSFKNLIV